MATEKDRGNATAIVTVVDSSGTESIKHELFSKLPFGVPVEEAALARVGTSRGVTLNMGNYESVRVDVWVTVPCHLSETVEAYEFVSDWCEVRVKDEVSKIRSGD